MRRSGGHLTAERQVTRTEKRRAATAAVAGAVSTSLSDDVKKDEPGGIHLTWEMDFPLRYRATLEGAWGLT